MITNPKGIDLPIQQMQNLFVKHLWPSINATKKGYYHRVFRNNRRGEQIPEIYVGNGEYKDVLFDDFLSAQIWFDVAERTDSLSSGQIVRDCGVVVIVNLNEIYPSLTHRCEEEVHFDVMRVLNRMPKVFEQTGITTGMAAFGNFNTTPLKHADMNPWHVFRFDCKIHYSLNC
jgi:hypothetical protein